MTLNCDIDLDLSGLQCPMPLLKAKLALNGMASQQVLKIIATDPASEKDFKLFASQSDNQIVKFESDGGAYTYWIRKA